MAVLDFWTEKLNPITMFSKEAKAYDAVKNKEDKRAITERCHLKESEFSEENYIVASKVKSLLGIGYKRINHLIKDNLDIKQSSFYFRAKTYYRKDHIEFILKILGDIKKREKVNVTEDYISSGDLKILLGIDTMQLFTLSNRNKWKKFKFAGHGNIKFFLRSQVLK